MSACNNLRNIIKPSCIGNNFGQFQQVRTKFVNWRMVKDYKRRLMVKEYGPERLRINMLRKNNILPPELRARADEEISAFPRDSCMTRLVYRCSITSRPTGNVKEYRMSRICFRHLADYNLLSGMQRAMW